MVFNLSKDILQLHHQMRSMFLNLNVGVDVGVELVKLDVHQNLLQWLVADGVDLLVLLSTKTFLSTKAFLSTKTLLSTSLQWLVADGVVLLLVPLPTKAPLMLQPSVPGLQVVLFKIRLL